MLVNEMKALVNYAGAFELDYAVKFVGAKKNLLLTAHNSPITF